MAKGRRKNKRKPPQALRASLLGWGPIAFNALAFLVLGCRFFHLISQYAVNIFFSDQWDFDDATLFQHHSLWEMFTWQHGPHRQGAGAVLGWLVEPLFRWNTRTESFFVGGIITVAALCALLLKRRLYGGFSYSDAIIPLVFLNPLQYETLFVTANLSHGPLPLLFVVLYCLAWTCRRVALRYGLVVGINFLTIYTGFGLLLGLLTPIVLAVDYCANLRAIPRAKIYFALALLLVLLSFASFFVAYKNQPAAGCFSLELQSLSDYAWYVALMFAPFFGAQGIDTWPTVVGALTVCALLLSFIFSGIKLLRTKRTEWTRYATIAVLVGYCLLFCVATAFGRLCLGIYYSQNSRYVIYMDLGLLGLYFFLLTISNVVVRNTLVGIFGLSLLGTIASAESMRGDMEEFARTKQSWKDCYLAVGDIQECNKMGRVYPWDPAQTRLQQKLDFLKETRQNLFADSK